MKRQELMEKCRSMIREISIIENQSDLRKLDGCPKSVYSAWPTGMPRGTNDGMSALLQRMDINEAIDNLEVLYQELGILLEEYKLAG